MNALITYRNMTYTITFRDLNLFNAPCLSKKMLMDYIKTPIYDTT